MEPLLKGEIVTVVPIRNHRGRQEGKPYRAVVLDMHYDDPRRAVVMAQGKDLRTVVWRSEIERDSDPMFAKFPSAGLPLELD